MLLYIVLELWSLVAKAWNLLLGGAYLAADRLADVELEGPVELLAFALVNIPTVGTWLITIGLGWPLFRDLNELFGLDLKKLFMWRSAG